MTRVDIASMRPKARRYTIDAVSRWVFRAAAYTVVAINVIRDLERIDDIAMDIYEDVMDLVKLPRPDELFHIPALADAVKEMLHDSVRAFIARDPEWARAICERDDVIDDLEIKSKDDVIEYVRENPDTLEPLLRYLSVTHSLERIGDHCNNISEMVIYLTQAKIIKHHYGEEAAGVEGVERNGSI